MLCNPASSYPDKVDEMIFFQDNSLEQTEIMKSYQNLIAQGDFTAADAYISQQEGIYGFFADFLNLIENRIDHLQEFLLNKPTKKQPFLYYDARVRHPFYTLGIFTDTDEEEDTTSILMFSDQDEQESTDGLLLFTDEEEEPPQITTDMIWI